MELEILEPGTVEEAAALRDEHGDEAGQGLEALLVVEAAARLAVLLACGFRAGEARRYLGLKAPEARRLRELLERAARRLD